MRQGLNFSFRGHSCYVVAVLTTFLILAIYSVYSVSDHIAEPYECYLVKDNGDSSEELSILEDVLVSQIIPPAGRSIFFHETKCHSPVNKHVLDLNARQACAIESAALNNPNFQVFVLFATPTYLSNNLNYPLIDALRSYNNVNFRNINVWHYARQTPLEAWFKKGDLFRSSYLTEHMADILRILTLYHFGGIYLDLDVVVLKTLEQLPLNYVGAHDNITLGNAVIGLGPRGVGHQVAELLLNDISRNYNGNNYVSNGPSLITRVLAHFCGSSPLEAMQKGPKGCHGFQIFNNTAFFPLPWPEWKHYTDPKYLVNTLARTKDSYLIHLWNKASYKGIFKVDTSNAYGKYAKLNCPKTFAAAGEYF